MKFCFFLMCLLSPGFQLACASNSSEGKKNDTDSMRHTSSGRLTEIPLPFEVDTFLEMDGKLLLISSEKLGYLNDKEMVTDVSPLVVRSRRRLEGVREKFRVREIENRPEYILCSPKNAAAFSQKVLVYAVCDHSDEIWTVDLGKAEASVNIVGLQSEFTTRAEGVILGPAEPKWIGENAFLPAHLLGTPRLYSLDSNNHAETFWQGSDRMGAIQSFETEGKSCWMALTDGNVLKSDDSCKTFKAISTSVRGAEPVELDFIDQLNGFCLTKNQLLRTTDGGTTWVREEISGSFSTLHANKDMVIVSGSDGLYFRRMNDPKWQTLTSLGPGFTGATSFKESIYILLLGKLYKVKNGN